MPALDGSYDSILVLGAVHGINPAMGWLFAVSLGLQAQSGRGAGDHAAHAHVMISASHVDRIGAMGVVATLLHTASYLAVAGAIAWIVYARLGLRLLRTARINVNVIWATALIVTAVVTPLV